jgi:hypothetical protein
MTEQVVILSSYSPSAFPAVPVSGNLISGDNTIAYLLIAKVTTTSAGITAASQADVPYIEFDKIFKELRNGTSAQIKLGDNSLTTALPADVTAANQPKNSNNDKIANTAYVDKMFKTLYSDSTGAYEVDTSAVPNYTDYEYIMVWCKGSESTRMWIIMPRQASNPVSDNTYEGRTVRKLTDALLRLYNNTYIPLPIGYLKNGEEITSILTSNIADFRIHQIVGVK